MLKQRRHQLTRAFASVMAVASRFGVLGRGLQEVVRDALRRLGADAGQAAQLVDEGLDRPLVDIHRASASAEQAARGARGPGLRSPSPSWWLALLRGAQRLADRGDDEVLEHLDVVGVDDLGGDDTARSSPVPVTVAFTMPPPADPSTVSAASASCAAPCPLACAASGA